MTSKEALNNCRYVAGLQIDWLCKKEFEIIEKDLEILDYYEKIKLMLKQKECVLRYIRWHQTLVVSRENIGNFFYNHDKYFSLQDKKLRMRMQKILSKLGKKYVFPCIGPESLLFHHGLPFFPEAVIHYLQGGSFVDAGACYGDSALIFSRDSQEITDPI